MQRALLALALVGCGRLDFATRPDAAVDVAVDTTPNDGTGLSYPELVLASGPLIYYRLGEIGQPDAFDASGNGNTGAYYLDGGGLFFDRPGALAGDPDAAVKFQGRGNLAPVSDAWVGFDPPTVAWAGDFTIEMFVQPHDRPLESDGFNYALFICELYLQNGFRFGWRFDDTLRVWTDESGSTTVLVSGATLRIGVYNHVALVHQAGTFTVYLDGVAVIAGPAAYVPVDAGTVCGFGAFQGMPTDATFDEVAIYERALPQGEIAAHFSAR